MSVCLLKNKCTSLDVTCSLSRNIRLHLSTNGSLCFWLGYFCYQDVWFPYPYRNPDPYMIDNQPTIEMSEVKFTFRLGCGKHVDVWVEFVPWRIIGPPQQGSSHSAQHSSSNQKPCLPSHAFPHLSFDLEWESYRRVCVVHGYVFPMPIGQD